jgi:hypothetical protein
VQVLLENRAAGVLLNGTGLRSLKTPGASRFLVTEEARTCREQNETAPVNRSGLKESATNGQRS